MTLLMTLVILASSFAHAQLDAHCLNSMKQAANGYNQTAAAIKSGALTAEEAESFVIGWKNAAQTSALTCVGIIQINMEKSLRGRLGLISDNEVERKSTQVYDEAMAYYDSLTIK